MKEALFWSTEGKSIRCKLCPHHCHIGEGKEGVCGCRKVIDGRLISLNYGRIAGMAVDPIEKKPLFHFYPGTKIFSIGTVGCNLHCPFCQNDALSRFFDDYRGCADRFEYVEVEELISLLERSGGGEAIAYTYSEPVVWYEYICEAMQASHEKGIKNVIVTNGFIEEKPLDGWLPYLDAANVDLKAFREEGYRRLGGQLEPVKRTIARLIEGGVHVEVTTLIVPRLNDSLEEIEALAAWLSSLSKEIPLHLSRYFPHYHYHENQTPLDVMHRAQEVARKHLFHVYLGNVVEESSTYCHHCGNLLIRREVYHIEKVGLKQGRCLRCGNPLWGQYDD